LASFILLYFLVFSLPLLHTLQLSFYSSSLTSRCFKFDNWLAIVVVFMLALRSVLTSGFVEDFFFDGVVTDESRDDHAPFLTVAVSSTDGCMDERGKAKRVIMSQNKAQRVRSSQRRN
jgi:hypothetical protein